jgi:4a-hydroxytetrahydrobiopterin dehydratase
VKEEDPVTDAADASAILAERCVPCHGGLPPATPEEEAELTPLIPDWAKKERNGVPRLVRTFRFQDYPATLAFTQRVGELAEAEDHHPTLLTEWGKVTVSWWTHAIRGLHRNDFLMAAKTDALAHKMGALPQ